MSPFLRIIAVHVITRSPFWKRVTPAPTSWTIPAIDTTPQVSASIYYEYMYAHILPRIVGNFNGIGSKPFWSFQSAGWTAIAWFLGKRQRNRDSRVMLTSTTSSPSPGCGSSDGPTSRVAPLAGSQAASFWTMVDVEQRKDEILILQDAAICMMSLRRGSV